MISGALLLDCKEVLDYRKCAKYIFRTLAAIVFWGFIYNFISLVIMNGLSNMPTALLTSVKMIIAADTTFCYQFWYLYMLTGVYLALPIISSFLHHSTKIEQGIAMLIFVAVSVCYQTVSRLLVLDEAGKVWFSGFAPFAGYLVYFLLGFWMSRHGLKRSILYGIGVTAAVQIVFVAVLLVKGDARYTRFTGYHSILTCELSILIFWLCRFLAPKIQHNRILTQVVFAISGHSFGIYVLHVMVLTAMYKLLILNINSISLWIRIPVMTLLGVTISLFGSWIIKKIPLLKHLI